MTAREEAAARLRTAVAEIDSWARTQLAELTVPSGATRTQRRAIQAARRAVWASRAARITDVTSVHRAQVKAAKEARSRALSRAHRAATAAAQARRRADRQVRAVEDVRVVEAALYRNEEKTR